MFILILYTSLIKIDKTIDIKNPTIEQYLQLYLIYSEKLTCSCNKISIKYDKIIKITYTFHQICHSDFINFVNYSL
ncbi:hypothetical protein I4U23_005589 [Adineta vaga]|nr:hypothetical protein I4U23_005589 [Adineta vaga]